MKEIARLDQSARLKGKRSFILQDDGILKVSSSNSGRRMEFTVNISQLNPEPTREAFTARQMFIGMLVSAFIVVVLVICASVPETTHEASLALLFFSGFMLLPTLLCWREYLKQSYDLIVFQNQVDGQRLFLLANLPTPASVEDFVSKLKADITSKREDIKPFSLSLADQIKELGKLKESGLLTDDEFAKAKANLIEASSPRPPIGFRP